MHMQEKPKTMQDAPKYEDVFADVNRFFIEHIARCERAGIAKREIAARPRVRFFGKISPIMRCCVYPSFIISACRCWWHVEKSR